MIKHTHAATPEAQRDDDRLQLALLAAEVCASATEAALEATHKLWAAEDEICRLLARQVGEMAAISETIMELRDFSQQSALSWEAALSAGRVAMGRLSAERLETLDSN